MQLRWSQAGDVVAYTDNDYAMANALHDIENVRTVNDRLPLTSQRLDQRFKSHGGIGIQPIEWFIKQNDRRIVQQSGRDDDFSAHALGVVGYQRIGLVGELGEPEQLLGAARGLGGRQSVGQWSRSVAADGRPTDPSGSCQTH